MKHDNKKRNLYKLPLFGYQLLIFFVQICILFVCIKFAQIMYTNDILPDKMVKENFPQTYCTIISKKLSEKGKLVHRYRADFFVSYTANNNPYRAWVTGNGLDQAFFHDRQLQEAALDQFEVGLAYPCWYNPEIPQITVLVLRHNWASTLPLAVPTFIGLAMIYYLFKNIMQFLGALALAMQNQNRRKK